MTWRRSDRGPWEATPTTTLELRPIGLVRSDHDDRWSAPRQPRAEGEHTEARIELFAGSNYEQCLEDLAGVEKIWVLSWFHRNEGWRPKVLPPRGPRVRRGVFATRSPHRPNPLGLSLVSLLGVQGRVLRVADIDLLDGTPVLDLKPYLPYAEAWPDARVGWLDAVLADERSGAATRYAVTWSPLAGEQSQWLREAHGIDLASAVTPVLARDPSPHPYRRVERCAEGSRVSVRSWRAHFTHDASTVTVTRLASGYRLLELQRSAEGTLLDDEAHRGFHLRWPGP